MIMLEIGKNGLTAKLSWKQELLCWLTAGLLAIALLELSHTFYVTSATYAYGLPLLSLVVLMFCLKFRRAEPQQKWLRLVANLVLVELSVVCLLYVLGVATWYE